VVACYVDMTERRRLLDQLRDSARRDPLTRMPNRSVVLERVQRAIEHRRRHPEYGFAVLFMDVDRFKQVNDTLGHSAGDELLRQVADRLNEALRPGDAVARVTSDMHTAARIGGDEFVIVLEGIRHPEDAGLVADRLLHDLSQPYQLGSNAVHVSVSIGIVGAEQADDDAGAVLRDCDTAMYEAKRAGRGRWMLFDLSMHERVRSALEMEGELRRALAEDELYVVYQPVVELADSQMAGVEALVRWQHPQRGEIPPGQFIGLAEECGLIDAIGDVVLQKACAQFARWQRDWGERAPRLLAVNLSRAQLKQPGLVPEVKAVLDANGMRPEQLQLEVTESFAAQDDQVQAMLRALKAAGVRLALDDFGTGYSSLACLHQLPVDTVKIDRSFVSHAREVEYHRVLIQATIRVARTLGMTTVAEGIETQDQAELMASLQCDRGQGWLYGRAMTAPELDRWIERESTGTLA
jgi:diguanylate cyclase (GGDEF)-like protein